MGLSRGAALLVARCLLTFVAAAHAESAWVLWEHSYEVWVDSTKVDHRRDVAWKRVATTAAKSECENRALRDARAEYDALTGKGIRATLTGSKVGFDQRSTRFTHGYRNFECWPASVDPRGPKAK